MADHPTRSIDLDALRAAYPLASIVASAVPLKRAGQELIGCCPFHNEKTPSFTVYANGERYHCFGCGAGGDVLDFVQQLHGVGLRDAAEMLCGGNLPIAPAAEPRVPVRPDNDRLEDARAIWRSAGPVKDTPADAYLRHRGLHLSAPQSLRFARLRYGKAGPLHPCLVAVVASVEHRLIGVQRTYLRADGAGKADVPKAKLSLGRTSGGAIRLAPVERELIVVEGIEDGLTVQQELGRPVWVSAGTSNLPTMEFPAGVESIAIGGDADAAGRAAAEKAAGAYARRGLQARTFFPLGGAKDFNAQLSEGMSA